MLLVSRCSKAVISLLMFSLMACTTAKGWWHERSFLHLKSSFCPRYAFPHRSIVIDLSFLNGNNVDNERAQERERDSRERSLQRQAKMCWRSIGWEWAQKDESKKIMRKARAQEREVVRMKNPSMTDFKMTVLKRIYTMMVFTMIIVELNIPWRFLKNHRCLHPLIYKITTIFSLRTIFWKPSLMEHHWSHFL